MFKVMPQFARTTLLTGCIFLTSQSQETDRKPPPVSKKEITCSKHNMGFAGGKIIGSGFSYRRWFAGGSGYQITFAPFVTFSDEKSSGLFNLGLSGLKSFYSNSGFKFLNSKATRSNAFIYYGINYSGQYREDEYLGDKDSTSIEYDEIQQHSVGAGVGVGFELYLWKMNFSLMGGFRAAGEFEKLVENSLSDPEEFHREFKTEGSGEFALHIPFGTP